MGLESFYGGKQGVSPVIKNRFKYITAEKIDEDTYYDKAYGDRIGHTTILTWDEYLCLRDNNALPENINISNNIQKKSDFPTNIPIPWTTETLKPFTMDECLKDVNYTDVWYGELCIIDTDSKYNPNNGKLYRRTLKQVDNRNVKTEDTAYAEYIGQIVGPMGGVSKFVFGSVDSARKMAVGELPTYSNDHVTDEEPLNIANWDYLYQNAENEMSTTPPTGELGGSAARYDDIAVLTSNNIIANEENLKNFSIKTVPGIELDENGIPKKEIVDGKEVPIYNDEIKYAWCNVVRKDDDKNLDAWVYMGFDIPYTVYESKAVNIPYWLNLDSVGYSKDTHNPDHPFYHNLHFYVPRGTRGIGPEEFFVADKNFNEPLYDIHDIVYDSTTDTYDLKKQKKEKENGEYEYVDINPKYPAKTNNEDSRPKVENPDTETLIDSNSYWVAKWTLYNPKQVEGNVDLRDDPGKDSTIYKTVYVYLGNYKDIHSINLDEHGTFSIEYSDGTSKTWTELITWITEISLNTNKEDTNYGQFKITFNNNRKISNIDENLHLIKNVKYDDSTGKITFTYSEQQNNEAEGIEVLDILTGDVIYPKQININTDKTSNDYGKVTYYNNIDFSDFSQNELRQDVQSKDIAILPLIKSNNYNPDTGIITFTYTGNPDEINIPTNNAIEYISVMKIDPNTGELQYKFNTDKVTDPWRNLTDDEDNNFILRDIVDLKISDGTIPTSVYNLLPNGILSPTLSDEPIYGHLYVQYRGDTAYRDVGLVKTKPTLSTVLQVKPLNNNHIVIQDGYFTSEEDAIDFLNNSGYNENTTPATYADTEGNILVKGIDQTGSFISFSTKDNNNDIVTYLAYYDPTKGNNGSWVSAGIVGGASTGKSVNIYSIINPNATLTDDKYIEWNKDNEIYFEDKSPISDTSEQLNLLWVNSGD